MKGEYNFEEIGNTVLIDAQKYIEAFAKTENNKNIICFCILYHIPVRIEYCILDAVNKGIIEDVVTWPFQSEEDEIHDFSRELYNQLAEYRSFEGDLYAQYSQDKITKKEYDKWSLLNAEKYKNMLLEVVRKLDFSDLDKHPKFVFMVHAMNWSYTSWNETVPEEWIDFYFE